MIITRCKVVCSYIKPSNDGSYIDFHPVTSGSVENEKFFRYTPGGTISFYVCNPSVVEKFQVGKEYYLDFSVTD